MAKRLNYTIGVNADTSKLEAQLNEAFMALNKLASKPQMVTSLQQASTAAADLSKNLQSAVNVDTGKINLSTFNNNLKASGQTLQSYYDQLSQLGPMGTEAFLSVAKAITTAELPLRRTNTLMDSLWVTMKNTMRWQITSSALNGFVGSLQTAYGYAKNLDRSLNEIRTVSGKSADDMKVFAEQANKAAKALSATTVDYTDASLIYYQQGLSDEEVLERTETTVKMANVAGQTAQVVSDQMTAVWNNFYDGSKSIEYYADVMVELGAATASSTDEIAEGLEKFAAIADTVGLSYEYAAAALATVTATTRQSADVVGTAFKTIFARIQDLELGETLDDGTTLGTYSKALEAVGIHIQDAEGNLRDMNDVLDEMGAKWDTISKSQQVALAEAVAGVRQYNQLIALMDNWDFFEENLSTAYGAEGALERQSEVYAESWEAARDRVTAAAEDIYDSIINPDLFIGLDDAFTPLLSGTADVIDAMGGLKGILVTSISLLNSVYGDKIAQTMRDTASQLGFITNQEQLRARALQQQAANLAKNIELEKMGAEGPQKEVLIMTQQQIKLQGLVNSKIDELTERQKNVLQQDLNHLKSLQEQSEEYSRQIKLQSELADKYKAQIGANITTDKKSDIARYLGSQKGVAVRKSKPKENASKEEIEAQEYAAGMVETITRVQKLIVHTKTAESSVGKLVSRLEDVSKEKIALQNVVDRLKDLGDNSTAVTKEIRQLAIEFGHLDQNASDDDVSRWSAQVKADFLELNQESQVLKQTLQQFLPETQISLVERFAKALQQGESAEKAFASAVKEAEQENEKITKGLNDNAYATKDWADTIVKAGSVLSQLSMSIQAIKNLGNVFQDSDMDTGERLISIFTSLGMLLPGLISLTNAFGVATNLVTIAEDKQSIAKVGGIAGSLGKAAADKILAKAEGQVAKEAALANAEFVAQLIALAPYIAIIAAVGVAIYALVKAYNADADAAKHAAEAAEQTSQAADEAKTAADNLRSSINAYDSAVEKLEECARGTEEWRDALKEVNEAAIEVLNNAGKLSAEDIKGLRNSDGSLNREALDNLQETADQRATNLSYATSAAEKYAADAQMRADAMALGRKAYSYRDEYDNGEGDMQVILDNYKELSQLADDELIPALRKLGFNVSDSDKTINTWKTAISDMADNAEAATEKFNLITQMQVEQVLGEAETTREQAIQAITTSNVDALTQELTKTWEDKLTGSGINKASSSNNAIYQEALKALQDAGYDVSKQTNNAVRGTDSNRSLAFLNSEGKEVVYNAEQIAAMIGAAQALDQISEKADTAKVALQNLDEDAISYIASGNLSNVTKEALSKFVDKDAIIELFGGEDAIKGIIAAQKDIDFDEVGTDLVEEFVNNIEIAATNAKTDFEEVGQGMAHSVQRALEDIDSDDLSLTEFQDIADIFNLAAAYGKLDEAIAAYEAGTLEEFANGIRTVTSTLEDFQTKYKDTHAIIDDIAIGDTISQEDYDKLGEEAQQYFTMMLDGTYKLTENAAEFYEATQKQLIKEAQNNKADLQERNAAYRNLQGYDFEGLSQNANYIGEDGNNYFNATVQQQLDLIRLLGDQSDTTKEKIQAWQEQLDEKHFDSVNSLQEIADMVGDCGAAYENLSETIAANEEEARAWDLAIASSYTNLDDLQEALDNNIIGIEAFTAAAVNLDKISDTDMLDAEEWENFADYLQDAAGGMEGLNDEMSDNEARIVAKGIMKMNDAIEDLADNFEDWSDIIQNSSEDSEEFADAMGDCRKAVANLLDVNEDFVSNNFIEENLGLIEQAATGSATAIDELKSKLAESIIANIIIQNGLDETTAATILSNFQSLRDSIPDIDVGVTLDDGDFLTNAQQLIADAGMTVDQVNALFDAMGFEANFKTEPVLTTQRVPEYVTETIDNGSYEDENGNTVIRTRTRTYQDGYYEAEGYIDAIAMTTNGKTPVVNGITRKASGSYNNYSNRNAGGGSPGGGGGSPGGGGGSSGKTLDKEKEKTLDEVEDRYHNINRQLERQSDLLDDIENATDRAYGKDKLAKFQEGIKALEKEQELLNTKLSKAESYLSQDAAAVKQYFSGAEIDANGEITNYEDLLRLNMEMYNAEVEKYNLAVAGKTLTDEESEALKAQLETAKTQYDIRLAALEQYEGTLDTIRDVTDQIEENARSIADQELEEIKYKLEIVIDVKSMYDSLRDLEKEIAESFGDALTHGLKSAYLSAEGAKAEAALLPDYENQYAELKALYESTTDDADRQAIMEEIQDLQGKIIDSASALVEWANSIEDIVPDAVDAAAERFAAFTDQLDHNTSVLDTIKELYTLQGVTYKTMDGFNRLQKVSQEKLEAQVASAVLQKGWYEEAQSHLAEAQARLDSLNDDETDPRYDTYKKARDAYLEEFNEAQEAYLTSAKEAMETAKDMYTQQIEQAVYEFGQAISNGVGLDLLQEQYDHYIEENERYLDTVNEAYEVASWYNKLQKDIDESTNSAQTQRLKALQEEIDARRENNTLSEYDLEILEAKYNVLQAQMALEDAQNAKNNLQLVRDSQGNWNYQYTADQDKIADAEQGLLDAQNDWYNIAKDQVTDITGEIVTMWKECQDKVKEIYTDDNLTYEEKLAAAEEVQRYYSEKAKYLEEEKNIAIKDMNEAGSEALIGIAQTTGEETADLIGEFTNTYADKLGEMTQTNVDFEERLNELLDLANQDFLNYQDTVDNVAQETGTTLDDLAEETDKVSDATDILRERGEEAASSLWDQIDAAQNASDEYLDLADSIWKAVYAMQALAREQANYAMSQSGVSSNVTGAFDADTDYSALMSSYLASGKSTSDEAYLELLAQRDAKIAWLQSQGYTEDYWKTSGSGTTAMFDELLSGKGDQDWYKAAQEIYGDNWQEKLKELGISGFATGGYTGTFDDARLAFLHEKELVLNQEDTANILAAVHAVRDFGPNLLESIEKALDNNTVAAMALMGAKLTTSMVTPQSDTLEQTIHIDKVEFPHATSRTEIEEAIVGLANDAVQWARRRT